MNIFTYNFFDQTQKIILIFITLFLLIYTPSSWIQLPDSGIYLGTAENMLDYQQYWFNGSPNLLYYPGISTLLLLPLSIAEDNFLVLQLYVVFISLIGIWGIRKYYSFQSYGGIAFFLPFLILFSSIYSSHIYAINSDCIFLTVSIYTLIFWKQYENTHNKKYLYWCVFLVSVSSLIRFQGIFICAALSLAMFFRAWNEDKKNRCSVLQQAVIVSIVISLPFLIWTIRNFLLHSPDTFNMANAFFFGMKGLDLYATGLPGNVSTEGINSFWQIPLYRSALYIGGLFEFLYGGISLNNKIILLPLLVITISLGIKPWVKRASHLELFYVIFSAIFLAKSIFFSNNLHIILRYWIPLLPFTFLMMGLGVQTIINYQLLSRVKRYIQGISILTVFIILFIGFPNISKHLKLNDYRQIESDSLASVKVFFDKSIPKESIVATTDWGVIPRTINRRSFLVLNDLNHKQTVARMLKYKTEFLVTYGKYPRMNDPTLAMVLEHPKAFTKIFSKNADNPNLSIFVYKVNLDILESQFS